MSEALKKQATYEKSGLAFVRRQYTRPKPLPEDIDLTGQVAIITGSNVGLGLEACRQLLQLRLSHLVMAVRSQAKGETAAASLRTAFPSATISVWIVDHESYDSIRAFVKQCESLPRIDIAILNAGVMNKEFKTMAATKHEATMQVNYLSTALLALLLLPVLKSKSNSANPPVLTLVGSDAAYWESLDAEGPILEKFDQPEKFKDFSVYSKTKLLQMLFVPKLAQLVSPDEVLVNIANPGATRGTSFFGPDPIGFSFNIVQKVIARSPEAGASTYLYAALAAGKDSHGAFTSDWEIKAFSEFCYTAEGLKVREKLWEETMTELNFAGVSKIVNDLRSAKV